MNQKLACFQRFRYRQNQHRDRLRSATYHKQTAFGIHVEMNLSSQPMPLGLYVHVPWCVRKCPYCDFNSHQSPQKLPEAEYIDALLEDLDWELSALTDPEISSIFIGGGTPSLLTPAAIEGLLVGIGQRVALSQGLEISMEANPGSVDSGRYREFCEAGINRLSIGIQSFYDDKLYQLGRIHDGAAARQSILAAVKAGFKIVNLDLMFGLPDQTVEQALTDLAIASAAKPAQISWYQLTIEPNTAFHRQPPSLPDDDRLGLMHDAGQAFLSDRGFEQYEISAYAAPKNQCLHNLNYWRFGDYIGIGAGAHGKISSAEPWAVRRRSKRKQPQAYMDTAGSGAVIATNSVLAATDLKLEFMMNHLRLKAGFTPELFADRTGLAYDGIERFISDAMSKGWLEADTTGIKPTSLGHRYLNDVLALLI